MDIVKYKALIVEHWVPALITGALGLIVGLSISLFEAKVSDNRFFLEKQAATADRVASEFSKYVQNWRRIIALKKYVAENNRKPFPQELEQLKNFVAARNTARDKLFSALDVLHLYFEDETSHIVTQFREWDEQQSTKTISELPSISKWQTKERSILLSMRKDLMK